MKFTDSHEWIEWENQGIAKVGVTAFAQRELGDIVYVELPKIGAVVNAQQPVAVLESTKAAADINSPVSGTIVGINEALKDSPEWINQSPQEKGWIYRLQLLNPSEVDNLMDEAAYHALLKEQA